MVEADKRIRFLLGEKGVRGVLVRGTVLVSEMRARHGLGLLETLVLGHGCLAALLLATSLKGEKDRIALRIECSGPIKGLVAEANGAGEVRGYLRQNPIPLEKPLESFDLSPFFGAGFLSVSTYPEGASQPFTGTVMLEHGNLALDLSHYFQTSEQTPTAIALSIQFDSEGLVVGAGGLLLQAMPGARPELMAELEERIAGLPSLGRYCAEGGEPEDLLAKEFAAFTPEILTATPVAFACPCSREEIGGRLLTLSEKDLDELRSGPFPVEACCHYCNTTYLFNREEMEELWQERTKK
ncbi:MAG: Hsp33 family molecular chaperone HslO [Proteobacteria bacterium]|jgi:molecular chaperone Hsp33|nr:Hsp33 family molecular chaperone HslO [Pseudomonadota bacterium]MBU4229788.1 Hsp33 family molecular chaperone HslO [Pseudomonadota bacterium]MBU4412883.1 Hsp33 family molecular chaperone HslO [Pseudomonadota bacterium]MCG2823366.1 Hsp33 family molecular chaperone HslO [Desulfobulbaceae bacterium]MDP2003963.1 Hsp33 family molecular chaperone HslO [Desulfurivibrionaceae bacterium]